MAQDLGFKASGEGFRSYDERFSAGDLRLKV